MLPRDHRAALEPGGDLAYVDEAGIDVAVLSNSTPGVHFGDDAATRVLAAHERTPDRAVRDRPDRFGAFATLPLHDVDGALVELDCALTTLELQGVSLMSNADAMSAAIATRAGAPWPWRFSSQHRR